MLIMDINKLKVIMYQIFDVIPQILILLSWICCAFGVLLLICVWMLPKLNPNISKCCLFQVLILQIQSYSWRTFGLSKIKKNYPFSLYFIFETIFITYFIRVYLVGIWFYNKFSITIRWNRLLYNCDTKITNCEYNKIAC